MSDRKVLPGKFVWFEHVSSNTTKAQEFYSEVLGWNVKPFPMGATAYEMILTGDTWDTMIGGYRRFYEKAGRCQVQISKTRQVLPAPLVE
jgi:predicted enzyme related to lactoylglutathione lyase